MRFFALTEEVAGRGRAGEAAGRPLNPAASRKTRRASEATSAALPPSIEARRPASLTSRVRRPDPSHSLAL